MEQLRLFIDNYESETLAEDVGGEDVLNSIDAELRTYAVISQNLFRDSRSVATLCSSLDMQKFFQDNGRWFRM